MKPIDDKSGSYAEYSIDSNAKDAKFKIGDHVRILKYKNIFGKGYTPNWFFGYWFLLLVKSRILYH